MLAQVVRAAALVVAQGSISDGPFVVNRALHDLGLRQCLARLGGQIGNGGQGARAFVAGHGVTLRVVELKRFGVAVNQNVDAIGNACFCLGKIEQRQVLQVCAQRVADAGVDCVQPFASQLIGLVAGVVDVVGVVAQSAYHRVCAGHAVQDVVLAVADDPVVQAVAGAVDANADRIALEQAQLFNVGIQNVV